MTTGPRPPRPQVARTDHGYVARVVANGRIVLSSGSQGYAHRRDAVQALRLAGLAWLLNGAGEYVDERTPPPEPASIQWPVHHRQTMDYRTQEYRDYWHDHEMHYRNCCGDECDEAVPPVGSEVQCRGERVTVTKAMLDEREGER